MKPRPFRDVAREILGGELGSGRVFTDFECWDVAVHPRPTPGGATEVQRGYAMQVWLDLKGTEDKAEVWVVDSRAPEPIPCTVRDLSQLHRLVDSVRDAASRPPPPEAPGFTCTDRIAGPDTPEDVRTKRRTPDPVRRAWRAIRDRFWGPAVPPRPLPHDAEIPGAMDPDDPAAPFRMVALRRIAESLGRPDALPVGSGYLYRWTLERPDRSPVYVTLDSPELPDIGHLMVSDPSASTVTPVTAFTVRTMQELEVVLREVLRQWKAEPQGG